MKQQFKQAVLMPKDPALCIHFTDIQNFFNFYYGVCWDSFLKKVAAQGITSLFVAQCRASTQMKKCGLAVTRFICGKSSSQISLLSLISTPFAYVNKHHCRNLLFNLCTEDVIAY